jgi:CelD/BcsL family acetyltransferase involved in cellulose biosynthesis
VEPGMNLAIATGADRAARSVVPLLPADRLSVEVKRDLDLDPEDARALDGLIDGRPYVGAFLSPAWLSGFFAEPPAGVEPSLALFRQGQTLRGIVPIAVRQTLTHVRVSLLGGAYGSDRVDLLAARGFEAIAADAFLRWLGETFGQKGFLLELRDVPASSSLWGAIQRAGVERTLRLALQPKEIYTLPYLALRDPEADAVPESPSAHSLASLKKHRRWLEHRCHLQIERVLNIDDAMDAFDHLVRFLRARWGGRAVGSVLDDPRAMRFHRRALPLLLAEGRLRMIRLRGGDRTIAVFYGLASGRWWGYYLAGYDREWAGRIRLGQIALATAIDMATQEGAAEFDFLKGAERIKYVWPVRERGTLDADVFSEKSGAQFTRATRATRDAAAALSKSARGLLPASSGL